MSCHFQHHLNSSRPLCIQADSSFVSFHIFWLDVAEQAAQIQLLEQPVWALWQEDSYEFWWCIKKYAKKKQVEF